MVIELSIYIKIKACKETCAVFPDFTLSHKVLMHASTNQDAMRKSLYPSTSIQIGFESIPLPATHPISDNVFPALGSLRRICWLGIKV